MTRSSREVVLALRSIVPIMSAWIKLVRQSVTRCAAPSSSCFSLIRRKYVESSAPEILCQTLNSALGTAASGEKCALANAALLSVAEGRTVKMSEIL